MRRAVAMLPLLLLADVTLGQAAGLTDDDCQVLAAVYGVTPAECRTANTVVVPAPVRPVQTAALPTAPVPAVASPVVPTPGQPVGSLHVDYVFFLQGGTSLDTATTAQLDALARMLESPPMQMACLQLVGHADSTGDSGVNQRLSYDRAETVAAYLRARLALPQRVVDVHGAGSASPLAGFAASAIEHRRVSLMVRGCTMTDLQPG